MPRWVCIVCRVVGGIGVQVLRPRAVRVSTYCILLEEPPRVRVVVARTQVIQPCIVLYSACKLHIVLDATDSFFVFRIVFTKSVVRIALCAIQCAACIRSDDVGYAASDIVVIDPILAFRFFGVVLIILPFARHDHTLRIKDIFVCNKVRIAVCAERQCPAHVEIHGVVPVCLAGVRSADSLPFPIIQAGV